MLKGKLSQKIVLTQCQEIQGLIVLLGPVACYYGYNSGTENKLKQIVTNDCNKFVFHASQVNISYVKKNRLKRRKQLWENHNLCVFKLLSDSALRNVKKVLASRTDCGDVKSF